MIKKCEICGSAYEFCPTCPRDMYKPAWMHRFESEKCKKLWDILSANGVGDVSNEDTAQALKELGYETIAIQNPAIKAHIERVMNDTPVVEEVINPPIETVEETENAEMIEDAIEAAMDEIEADVLAEEQKPKKRKGFRH